MNLEINNVETKIEEIETKVEEVETKTEEAEIKIEEKTKPVLESKLSHVREFAYLDGLRGLACLIVVLHHFFYAFLPALISGENGKRAHINSSIEYGIANSPLRVFFNGSFAVFIFFVMSAFVLSFMFFKKYDYVDKRPLMKDSEFLSFATIKRYPRLVIPIFLTSFVMWVFYRLNFVYSDEMVPISNSTDWLSVVFPLNQKQPTFLHLIRVSFIDLFTKGDTAYNNVLWTIKYEFFGSLLVFAILALFGRSVFRYLVYFILILKFGNTEYMGFIIGVFLADMFYSNNFQSFRSFFSKPFVSITLFLFGLYMGSYSRGISSKYYSWMNIFDGKGGANYKWIYTIGATFVVLSLLYNKGLQKIFSASWLLFCGRISYAMYLLHSILIGTLASYVMYVLHGDNYSYGMSIGLTFFIFMVILFAGSFFFTKYVDEWQVSKTKELLKRFS